MIPEKIGFIGLGHIGGSVAKTVHRIYPDIQIVAYDTCRATLDTALQEGVISEALDQVGKGFSDCNYIYLCAPVLDNADYVRELSGILHDDMLLTDVGSVKTDIHEQIQKFPDLERHFIGGHPMCGTEHVGYEYSTAYMLENAYYIITPTPHTPASHTDRMVDVAKAIGALPLVLDYHRHDFIVAAISHLPHLIASSLVNLVHDCDSEDQMMKRLAAGGFKDITRIASSSPVMWEQICMTNTDNITEVLDRYIDSLTTLREELSDHQSRAIYQLFESSRDYRNSFAETPKGSIQPEYAFSADVVDEPGAISIISSILSGKGISIKNIGISHNREHGEGALRISFYDKASMEAAWARLKKYNYTLFA